MKKIFSKKEEGGYMLVEILVSLMIFTLVAVSSTASLLAIIDANTKAQTLKAVMDNLSVAVENVSRSLRIGTDYKCIDAIGDPASYDVTGSYDNAVCGNGKAGVSFLPQDATDNSDREEYYFKDDQNGNGTIYRYRAGVETPMTAPEVKIDNAAFYVFAASTTPGQARVFMVLDGEAGATKHSITGSKFNIQTSVSQRQIEGAFSNDNAGGSSPSGGGSGIVQTGQTYILTAVFTHHITINTYDPGSGAFTATGDAGGGGNEAVSGTITSTAMSFSSSYKNADGSDAGYTYFSSDGGGNPSPGSFSNGQYSGLANDTSGQTFSWTFTP